MTDEQSGSEDEPVLGPEARAGVRWMTLGRLGLQVAGLVYMVVLARLLAPEDYGVYGMAYVAVHLGIYLEGFKLEDALIQAREAPPAVWDASFRFALVWGAAAFGLLTLAAPLVAWLFEEAAVTLLLPVMAAAFIVRGSGLVHRARLRRAFRFKSVIGLRLAGLLAGGAAGVGVAWGGGGAWSLVAYLLVQETVAALGAWRAEPWRPRRRGSWRTLRPLMRFGGPATANDLAMYTQFNVLHIVIGRVFGAEPLGLYRVGSSLAQRPLGYVQENTSQVAFPVFARMAEAPERLRQAFLKAFHLWALAVAPMVMLLIVLARELIDVVYGARWLEVAALLPVLALLQASMTLQGLISRLLLGRGQPRTDLMLHAGAVTVLVPAVLVAWPHGLETVLWTAAVCFALQNVASLGLLGRWLGWKPGALVRRLAPAVLVAGAVGGLAAWGLGALAAWPAWGRLLLVGPLGAGAYLAGLALLDPDGLAHIRGLLPTRSARRAEA